MKIVCDSCSAKYSIEDEKVHGKTLRIRCRKCGHVMLTSAPAAEPTPAKLHGQRGESSLLFSLNNLAALSSPGMPAAAATAAGGEGSGLLDLRRLAQVYVKKEPAAPRDEARPAAFAVGGGEPALLLPVQAPARGRTLTLVLFGAIGGLALALVAMLVLMRRGGETREIVARPVVPAATATGTATSTSTVEAQAQAQAQPEGAVTASATSATPLAPVVTPPVPAPELQPSTTPPTETQRSRRRTPHAEESAVVDTGRRTQPDDKDCLDEVGCLLATNPPACCVRPPTPPRDGRTTPSTTSTSATTPDPRLPKTLGNPEVSKGVDGVRGRAMACGEGKDVAGKVELSVKVAPSGKVETVKVKSSPDAALGTCVAAAMRKASFPATQEGRTFAVPWVFR